MTEISPTETVNRVVATKWTLQDFAHLTTILAAIIGVPLALWTLDAGADELTNSAATSERQFALEREIAANASWERYMEMAAERPDFAAGLPYSELEPEERTSYLWFVERMLFAGEQVLAFGPDDIQWKLAIQIEVRSHKSYIESDDFLADSICAYTTALRRTVAEAFEDEDPTLSANIAERDRQCTSEGYLE